MSAKTIGNHLRSFIIRSIQCIVESRLGGDKVITIGKPTANEWFYIAMNDYHKVNEVTKRCLEHFLADNIEQLPVSLYLLKTNWRIYCEISLKTTDNDNMILEYWSLENKTLMNEKIVGQVSMCSSNRNASYLVFNSYNQMSIMLKTIISLARATPGYKLSKQGQSADSFIICYRVFTTEQTMDQVLKANVPDANEQKLYSKQFRLGTVNTEYNNVAVSLIYRTDIRRYPNCRDAAPVPQLLPLKSDHFAPEKKHDAANRKNVVPAFANEPDESIMSFLQLPDTPFASLLPKQHDKDDKDYGDDRDDTSDSKQLGKLDDEYCLKSNKSLSEISDVIKMDDNNCKNKPASQMNALLSTSPGTSSLDSFVFVDLKPPFAPDDQHEIGSFFNGPAPNFTENSLADEIDDITTKLEEFETNVAQWDEFVASINQKCDDEEEKA